MKRKFNPKQMKWFVFAAVALALIGAVLAPVAFARIAYNTIDPVASVTGNGRHLGVSGPIICNSPESAYLRVTVTQRSTGAVAEGVTLINCTDILQQWQVLASTRGNENFEPGPAIAVAIAATSLRGQTTDAHQWLVPITLVER